MLLGCMPGYLHNCVVVLHHNVCFNQSNSLIGVVLHTNIIQMLGLFRKTNRELRQTDRGNAWLRNWVIALWLLLFSSTDDDDDDGDDDDNDDDDDDDDDGSGGGGTLYHCLVWPSVVYLMMLFL